VSRGEEKELEEKANEIVSLNKHISKLQSPDQILMEQYEYNNLCRAEGDVSDLNIKIEKLEALINDLYSANNKMCESIAGLTYLPRPLHIGQTSNLAGNILPSISKVQLVSFGTTKLG